MWDPNIGWEIDLFAEFLLVQALMKLQLMN